MELGSERFNRCDLVTAKGRLDTEAAHQLSPALETITAAKRYNIVLDMEEVTFISSGCLRVLLETQKTCTRRNRGKLVLAAVPERIYGALDLAGVLPLFDLYEDALHAVGSF
jgi:anti-anti-sigma factor